jgi:AmmeMemoRadiSam system protein B
LANSIRTPQFAGRVYHSDPAVLKSDVMEILALEPLQSIPNPKNLKLLKVPHIDYFRGHRSYGKGYQLLQNSELEVIFLMGTSHQLGDSLFIGTKNLYSTPLGIQQNADDIIEKLIDLYGTRFLEEASLHTHEHSLELQMPFITTILPNAKIVPILVGSLYPFYNIERSHFEPYEKFIKSMVEIISDLEKKNIRYGFIAGVDMAHVGQAFGDTAKTTKERLEQVQKLDEQYLNYIIENDPDKLFLHCVKDNDAQRICGHSTMMTISDILKRQKQVTSYCFASYEQCFSEQNDCLVSIASLGIYSK